MYRGILLAVFGSGSLQGESTLRAFETSVRERFPDVPVRWAFTSDRMRERLASARKKSDSVRKALDKMAFERFTHVAVQPLHAIGGLEYGDIVADVALLRAEQSFTRLSLGAPLLTDDPASVTRMARALVDSVPQERRPEEPVLFMGHGSRHAAAERYAALAQALAEGYPDQRIFVGTLNGALSLDAILVRFKALPDPVRRVWLIPLLGMVGRHTLEDMAGESETSCRSRLEAAGIECKPVLQGLLENPTIAALWLRHLDKAMQELQPS